MSEVDSADMGPWLSPDDMEYVRRKVPILYVDVVPVRLDSLGHVDAVGMLLLALDGTIERSFPTGRVLFHESLREALARHIDKDLGAMSLPQLPASLTPFAVSEYFPTPGTGLYDARQHAVSLAYIVPMQGDCHPGSDSLEFSWFTPGELRIPELQAELKEGHDVLLREAMAQLGIA
ncbi:MAG: DUF4916 domain-containing protein [Actinomycetaceae bacterium]|nr:DUF4916 domain-containing protein [Actinomycetaceae bacterium]MDY6083338.1 DUF4916 domain-containing protein [Actinomycetaceae bacterium]